MADTEKTPAAKTEASGNPAVPGAQPNQPAAPATTTNQTNSGPSNVTPPVTKEQGKGDPAQTTQSPEDGKQAPSPSGSPATQTASAEPEEEDDTPPAPTELDMLKKRATLMGVTYSNNISVETLKEKIAEKLAGDKPAAEEAKADTAAVDDEAPTEKPAKKQSLRQYLNAEKKRLIRVRITNLDPKKKDLQGEIFTVSNEYIGTIRRFVPFGEVTDNGWHIEKCIYDMMKERKFISIKTRKDSRGQMIIEKQDAREFALEVLEPLTQAELAQLAAAQQAAGGL